MELNNEEKKILEGQYGKSLQKSIKTLVDYGEIFGAKRLVSITGPGHMVTSFGIPVLEPLFEMIDEFIKDGISAKEAFTVNPRPIDYKNVKCNLAQKFVFCLMYGKQKSYEKSLEKIGLKSKDSFSCACYLPEMGNRPNIGDVLAWAESSAVVFANSVLGARTNRNSGIIELLSNIIGKTPEFDLLTFEGRQAKYFIKTNFSCLPDPNILGDIVGKKVVKDVPYITGLDKFLNELEKQEKEDYLKNFGAACASSGAIGLYHIENITPEAIEHKDKLLRKDYQDYCIDEEQIKKAENKLLSASNDMFKKPGKCFIGCPHLSFQELYNWSNKFLDTLKNEKKAKVETVLCSSPPVLEKFAEDKALMSQLEQKGVKFTSICPLMYMNNPLCARLPVITNSNKLSIYSTAQFVLERQLMEIFANGSCL